MKNHDLDHLKDLQDSDVCRACAECCKRYSYLTGWSLEVERLQLLKTDLITTTPIKKGLWKVTFEIPCRHLVRNEDSYRCDQYQERPAMCRNYPFSFIQSGDPDLIRLTRLTCRLVAEPSKKRDKITKK